MQTTKKTIVLASTDIARLQLLICYVNTCVKRLMNRFLLIRRGLSVVSDLRNVLRDKQERLTM